MRDSICTQVKLPDPGAWIRISDPGSGILGSGSYGSNDKLIFKPTPQILSKGKILLWNSLIMLQFPLCFGLLLHGEGINKKSKTWGPPPLVVTGETIVFNVPLFDSTTLAIAKNNARSHLMCITRAAPAWFEWSELFKLFDWVEFCQRLFFEPTARKIILQNSTKSKSLKCKPNSNQAGAALVIHIKWLRALFFKMDKVGESKRRHVRYFMHFWLTFINYFIKQNKNVPIFGLI